MAREDFTDQDTYLDEMTSIAQRLKGQIDNINAEVNVQTDTVTKLDIKLTKTQENMKTIDGQLDNMREAIGTFKVYLTHRIHYVVEHDYDDCYSACIGIFDSAFWLYIIINKKFKIL